MPQPVAGDTGRTTLYAYDAVNRLTSMSYPSGSTTTTYDLAGQRTAMTDPSGTTTWTYDATFPALPTRIEAPSAAGGTSRRTTLMTYDAAGRLTSACHVGANLVPVQLAPALTERVPGVVSVESNVTYRVDDTKRRYARAS